MKEGQIDGTTPVALRAASGGNYDNVAYAVRCRAAGEAGIPEDDRATVCGTGRGLYTYETAMGAEVTIPFIRAGSVN